MEVIMSIKTVILALICVIFQDSIQAAQVRAGLIYAARRGHSLRQPPLNHRIGRCPIDSSLLPFLEEVESFKSTPPVCPRKTNDTFLNKLRSELSKIMRSELSKIKGLNKTKIKKVCLHCCGCFVAVKSNVELDLLLELYKALKINNDFPYWFTLINKKPIRKK
jgi:hypothetical protein